MMTSEVCFELFHDGGRYHIETSPLICRANQWTGFYMISAFVMKELKQDIFIRLKYIFENIFYNKHDTYGNLIH